MKKKIFFILLVLGFLASPLFGQTSLITLSSGATILADGSGVIVCADGGVDDNSGNNFLTANSGTFCFTPTPVELVSFTAEVLQDSVVLYWETATEINNYGFDVERTLSGVEAWETLGFVVGHGNSNSPKYYEFVDMNRLVDGAIYRLKQIDTDGGFEYYRETVEVEGYNITDVEEETLPTEYSLEQNYPNPFNPTTVITYSIPKASDVSLKVYNTIGEVVSTLVNGHQEAGKFNVTFNANNLPSGVYFYSIRADGYSSVKKMLLIK